MHVSFSRRVVSQAHARYAGDDPRRSTLSTRQHQGARGKEREGQGEFINRGKPRTCFKSVSCFDPVRVSPLLRDNSANSVGSWSFLNYPPCFNHSRQSLTVGIFRNLWFK